MSSSSSSSSPEIVLTSSPDGPIFAYDASTGDTIVSFTGSRSPRRGLTLAGNKCVAASHVSAETGTGSIHLYNWYTSNVFHNFPVPEPVAPLAATHDGSYIFAGGLSGSIHSLSLASGETVKSFPVHAKPISSLQLNDDGSLVISGSDDGSIVVIPIFHLVEVSSEEKDPKVSILHRLEAHSNSVTALCTGTGLCSYALISCSLDCTCKFWNLTSGALLKSVAFPCAIFGVAIDPLEFEFYAAGSDGLVYKGPIVEVGSREKLEKEANELVTWSKEHNGSIVALGLVNEGRDLVSATEDGSVWVWEIEKGEVTMVMGNAMVNISDMVVAYGIRGGGVGGSNIGEGEISDKECPFEETGVELLRPMREILPRLPIEDIMSMAAEDKRRAIDMLRTAIGMYERLLELILEEATRAIELEREEGQDDEEKEERIDSEDWKQGTDDEQEREEKDDK